MLNVSIHASRRLGEDKTEGSAWNGLAIVLQEVGRPGDALTAYANARKLLLQTGNLASLANLYNNEGVALSRAGRLQEAFTVHEYAGLVIYEAGSPEQAIPLHEAALAINRSIPSRRGEAVSLGNIGAALAEAGRLEDAISAYCRSAEIFKNDLNAFSAGEEYEALARTLQRAGKGTTEIRSAWEAATRAYIDAGALGNAARARHEAESV
ncbi:tetratricopeptide repeat protein [Streptomyces sp. NPDC007808]|uniref:tetratricopeptide repeat protein n=1 Tax=Streptomyces sp. NPDC007808 TaxID=3364779 RepID=UPI0036CD7A8D